MMKKEILKRLEIQKNEVLKRYPDTEWLVITLYGSQNYGTQVEGSDIDSKMIVFPSLDDIVFGKQKISHVVEMPDNGEQIDVKDIRLMCENFIKQNINYLEILFTKYYIVNTKYQKYWEQLQEMGEKISRYDRLTAHKAIKGMAYQKRVALSHRYPSLVEKIDKYGYDPKQFLHIVRLEKFLKDYKSDIPFAECLTGFPKSVCDLLRSGEISLEDATDLSDRSIAAMEDIGCPTAHKNEETRKEMDTIIFESIKEILRKEIMT